MKKQDQCKAIYLSSHLFWQDERSGGHIKVPPVRPCHLFFLYGRVTFHPGKHHGFKETSQELRILTVVCFLHPQDEKKVLDCLKKSLKIAGAWSKESTASSTHLALFVDILNQYLYFFDAGYE